jgi:hypothetical protein
MRHLLILLVVACASPPKNLSFASTWPERARAYEKAYDRWTRHSRSWRQFVQAADGFATLKSSEFRAAFAVQRARDERRSEESAAKLVADEQAELGAGWQIELVVQTAYDDWNDFSNGAKSMWHVALIADGVASIPTQIIEDPRPKGSLKVWFPGMDPWHRAYVVTFPVTAIPAEAKQVRLQLSCPQADLTFEWN